MTVTVNGELRTLNDGTTVAALIAELGLRDSRLAVEVNQDVVSRGRYAEQELRPGDVVEIVQFVGGG